MSAFHKFIPLQKLSKLARPHPEKYPKFYEIEKPNPQKMFKFLIERSHLYVKPMTLGCASNLADYLAGTQNFELIPDRQIQYVCMTTVVANNIKMVEDWFILSFDSLSRYRPYPGNYYCVRSLKISKDFSKMTIDILDQDDTLKSVLWSEGTKNSRQWDQAKIHLQAALQMNGVACSHTFVHFFLPSVVSIAMDHVNFSKDSVLFNLLQPHLRHTEAINYQAMFVRRASSNTNTIWNRSFNQACNRRWQKKQPKSNIFL